MKHSINWTLILIAAAFANPKLANALNYSLWNTDISLSGFATAGFAISDQNYRYQRFISNDGTFKRDSIFGGQIDFKFNNEFSITAQAKLTPSIENDHDIDAKLTWAFLSWRPTNDLLFRGGRVRIPLYLNSQNTDIGATFDFVRLPAEVYTTAPTTDIDGLSGSKTWNFSLGELTLDAYVGTADTYIRFNPYNFPPLSHSAFFIPLQINLYGAALSFQHEDSIFRIGVHDTYSRRTDGNQFTVSAPFVEFAPGIGYYQVDNQALPGPGIPEITRVHSVLYTVGADIALDDGFRVIGEYVRREIPDVQSGLDSQGGYLALLKSIGDWTPYVSVAHLQSSSRTLSYYNSLNNNKIPGTAPIIAALNASQKAAASQTSVFDQTTWALGTSYRINPTSKLKFEWAITQVGDASSFVDAPVGEDSGHRLINVISFSYNVVF